MQAMRPSASPPVRIVWTAGAVGDLARLHDFLAQVNVRAAASVVQSLTAVGARLLDHPRIGEKLDQYEPREVRRVLVDRYEVRYEVTATAIAIRSCISPPA